MIARFAPFVAALVLAGSAHAFEIEEVTSPGGINAWLVEDHSIPFVALDIWFDGGPALDEPGARGAVNLMTALLEEGAGDLSAQEFAAEVEGLAASFEFDTYRSDIVVSVRMLTQNREEATALLRQALVAPRFDPDAIERVRQQVLSGIEADLQDPETIGANAFDAMAFGDHPFGSPLDGTMESVAALTRDDLLTAHRNTLTRGVVSVGAAGDITGAELGELLDELLGELPAEGPPLPGDVDPQFNGGVTVVDYPTPQSVVYFGQTGIDRNDPDFFAAFVMNQILGAGGYRNRLMAEVREARGLTYGISSYLDTSPEAPLIQGMFSSSNALVAEAIEVVRAEWEDIATNGVSETELADAIEYMTGAYPLRFDGNGRIAGILAAMQSSDMPIAYIENRNDYVAAVTVEDVRRVASRVLNSDSLTFVVVGQPEGLDAAN